MRLFDMSLAKEMEQQGSKLFKYRGKLPIVILLLALALHAYQSYNGGIQNAFLKSFNYQLVCLLVSLLGLGIRIITLGFVFKNTSGRNTTKQIADSINKTGSYSMMRHPLYVGNFLMWLGIGMLTANLWFNVFFILSFWLYYERIMYAEESYLIGKFGEEYTKWSATVPAFVPKLSNWTKPQLDFSWSKIIRQEKSGIAALFIVFMLFHQLNYYFENNDQLDLSLSFWNLACILSIVYLLIVKLVQKTTNLLDDSKR